MIMNNSPKCPMTIRCWNTNSCKSISGSCLIVSRIFIFHWNTLKIVFAIALRRKYNWKTFTWSAQWMENCEATLNSILHERISLKSFRGISTFTIAWIYSITFFYFSIWTRWLKMQKRNITPNWLFSHYFVILKMTDRADFNIRLSRADWLRF